MDSQLLLKSGDLTYSMDLAPLKWEQGMGRGEGAVCDIAARDGLICLACRNPLYPIMCFDHDGNFIKGFGSGLGFGRVHGIWLDNDGTLFVTDDMRHIIYHLDGDGRVISTLGTLDTPCDNGYDITVPWPHDLYTIQRMGKPFNRPTCVIRASSGRLYIADGYGNTAVHRFSRDEKYELSWGGPGRENGRFRLPHMLCEDGLGHIWVADRENFRVQAFDADGNFLFAHEKMAFPADVWSDGKYVYALEMGGFITVFDTSFQIIARLGCAHSPLANAHSISGDEQGSLYLGFLGGPYRVMKLSRV